MALPTITVTAGTGTTVNTLANGGQAAAASSHPVVLCTEQGAPGAATATLSVSQDGSKSTYSYGGVEFAPVATPTDVLVITGSATTTVRVKLVSLWGTASSAGQMTCQLVKRSSAGTLGSAVLTAITAAKHDSGQAAATAAVSTVGTANYTTLGTAAGVVRGGSLQFTAVDTGVAAMPIIWDFSSRSDKAIILRGVAEMLCVNFNGDGIPAGGKLYYSVELEEDNS